MTPELINNSGANVDQSHARAEQAYDREELIRQAFQQGAEYAAQQLLQQQVPPPLPLSLTLQYSHSALRLCSALSSPLLCALSIHPLSKLRRLGSQAELEEQARQQHLESLRQFNEQKEIELQARVDELHSRSYTCSLPPIFPSHLSALSLTTQPRLQTSKSFSSPPLDVVTSGHHCSQWGARRSGKQRSSASDHLEGLLPEPWSSRAEKPLRTSTSARCLCVRPPSQR